MNKILAILLIATLISSCKRDAGVYVSESFINEYKVPEMIHPFENPLNQTSVELEQLEMFFTTLSDYHFIQNPKFKKP